MGRTVHKNGDIACHICFKVFNSVTIKGHLRTHNPKTPCDIWGKLVAKMKHHMDTVHQDDSKMPDRCFECNRGFPNERKLKDHMMSVHLKLRPYVCRYGCDQSYNDRSNRRQHEKRAHGIIGPREAEKEELERKLRSSNQTESFHPRGSFDQTESVLAKSDGNFTLTCLPSAKKIL